jgi:hypothetical protein
MTNFAQEFFDMIETYQSYKEVWDDDLDIEILEQQAAIKRNPKLKFPPYGTKYFSPSSVSSCQRELYLKLTGAKKDEQTHLSYQRRWTLMGTAYGDMLQRQLLFIEKHYEKVTGEKPAFTPQRTPEGYPMWEDFAKTLKTVTHKGHTVNLFGTPDGLLTHSSGTPIGIEIKSKQTSHSKTSEYSMKEPTEEHFLQCVAYSIMFGIDDYLIVYGNLSKKNWIMSEEEYKKYPDLRVFHRHITDSDRQNLLDRLVEVLDAANKKTPPKMNIDKFTFNNFKEATAKSLTDNEFNEVKEYVKAVIKSNIPQYKKDQAFENFQILKELRGN